MTNHTWKHDNGARPWNAGVRRLCLAMALLTVLAVMALAAPARAQTATTFVSNLDAGTDVNLTLVANSMQRFTTGSNTSGYTLTGVDIESNETNAAGSFTASLCTADTSGNPLTTSCIALTAPTSLTTGVLNFTAPANTTLDADTKYFVRVAPVTTFRFVATAADDEDMGTASGWSIDNAYYFLDPIDNTWALASSGNSLRIAIKGTPRPLVLVSNASETPTPGNESVAADELVAVSFTTGANRSGYRLSSVGLSMRIQDSAVPAVAIYDDSSGSPGTSQAPLTNPDTLDALLTTEEIFTASGVDLAANTTYWVVVDKGTAGTLRLAQTLSDEQTGVTEDWAIGDVLESKTGTGSWTAENTAVTLRLSVRGTVVNLPPTRTTRIPDQLATVGAAYSYTFPANLFSDPDGDTLTYTATKSDNTALPSWLTFTASTRTFSGTPTTEGVVSVEVKADDGNDNTANDIFHISVKQPRPPALISTTGPANDSQIPPLAQGFETGSHTAGYQVLSVGLNLSAVGAAVPSVEIYSDSSGSPGTSLHNLTLSGTADEDVRTEEIFTASGVDLAASTVYHVVVRNSSSSGTIRVSTQETGSETGETGWTIHNEAQTLSGSTWDFVSDTNMRMSVYGAAINSAPEYEEAEETRSVVENTYVGQVSQRVEAHTFSGDLHSLEVNGDRWAKGTDEHGKKIAERERLINGRWVTAQVATTERVDHRGSHGKTKRWTDPDGDTLTFSVAATSDSDAAAHLAAFNQDFTLNPRTGQVSIKHGALIDYEDRTSYKVKLQVSDGKDRIGDADNTIDDTVTLVINVIDVVDDVPHTTRPPQVSSPGSDCYWTPGEEVVVTLNFNEAVTVDTTGGTPSLTVELPAWHARSAVYKSGSGTRDLKFAYTVADSDGTFFILRVAPDSLALNAGAITRTATPSAGADLRMGPRVWPWGDVSRAVRCPPWPVPGKPNPTITGVEVGGAWEHGPNAGTWGNGKAVDVWLTFSEPVDVFNSGQPLWAITDSIRRTKTPPTVTIKTTFGARTAEWTYRGPATNRLLFRYWPTGSDGFLDEVELVANSLTLNDTRIRSDATGQPVVVITHDGTGSVTPQSLLVGNDNEDEHGRHLPADDDPLTTWAQAFTTGSDSMTLGGVRLRGRFTDDLTVSIWSSQTGTVGTQTNQNIPNTFTSLTTLGHPGPLTYSHWLNVSDYWYFRSPGGVQLAANTTYFVVIEEGTAGAQEVQPLAAVTTGTGQTGVTGWTLGDRSLLRQTGVSWSFSNFGGPLMLSVWGTSGGASGASGSQGAPGDEQPEEVEEPFTAALEGLPASHDGSSPFTFTLRFSREPDTLSYRDIEAGLVYVKGATLSRVRRVTPGSDQAWALTVTPNQNGDVVIRVLPRSCDSTLAFCADGEPLAESLFETVPGPDTAPAVNNEATGGPTVTGTPQVGQTLTAGTDGITDADGLTNAVFAYQWIRQDLATALSEEIPDATGSTYTVTDADLGHTLMVVVTFTDDAGNEEELSSFPLEVTEAQQSVPRDEEAANSPATGAPTISGTAQVGSTLTADTSGIADEDGLATAAFTYQWLADDTEISGATGSTYTLTSGEQGKAIRVRVTFTDDAGNEESATSDATAAVAAQQPPPSPSNLEATVNSDGHVVLTWDAPDDDSVTGYQVLRRRPAEGENTLQVYVADTGSTATTYTDTNVTAGTQHVYRVKAINAAGVGGRSNYVNVTP